MTAAAESASRTAESALNTTHRATNSRASNRSCRCDGGLERVAGGKQGSFKDIHVGSLKVGRENDLPAIYRWFPVHLVSKRLALQSSSWIFVGLLRYRLAMGRIRPQGRFAIRLFLRSLASWKPGETAVDEVYADRRQWATTVLDLLGDDCPDDLEMLALESLARAALALCDNPGNAEVVAWFEEAGRGMLDISQLSS